MVILECEAVGFSNGHLRLVDAITLDDCLQVPFTYSKDAITHIQFSENSTFLATAVGLLLSFFAFNKQCSEFQTTSIIYEQRRRT